MRTHSLPMARIELPSDGSSVLHLCRRPAHCCYTCAYHAPGCRHLLSRLRSGRR